MNAFVAPVVLADRGVRLEPLTPGHADGLEAASADGRLWTVRVTSAPAPGGAADYVALALSTPDRVPFAVVDEATGRVLGTTSYHDIVAAARRVEIGYTFYAASAQRTHVNTVAKRLLLTHAFEVLGCGVVGWRTDVLNLASQRAIERLGAKRDGVIRGNAVRRDGTVRDTVMYSVTADEWPAVRERLGALLAAHDTAP